MARPDKAAAVAELSVEVGKELERKVKVQGISSSDRYFGMNLKKALDSAESEAGKLKDEYISTEHLFLGLLDQPGTGLKKIFQHHRITRDAGNCPHLLQ